MIIENMYHLEALAELLEETWIVTKDHVLAELEIIAATKGKRLIKENKKKS